MDEEIKKDAEEEMNCILIYKDWCPEIYDHFLCKYGRTCKNDQITSWEA